jgi:asparagine synthase (glutamine-hydrolysing)
MCGIGGILDWRGEQSSDFAPNSRHLDAMGAALRHRGPDGQGQLLRSVLGLVHTRLSIIDIEGGHQPVFNEDGRVAVVFNGEVFNFIELREMLLKRGHLFRTHSDTEVIVHLYEEFGDGFVSQLNGQFAIALWDERHADSRRLLLVRDRVGIAPLFYRLGSLPHHPQLAFASEVKAILPIWPDRPVADRCALDQIMSCWAPVGERTLFEGVCSLLPGSMLIVEQAPGQELALKRVRYWDWMFPESPEGYLQDDDEAVMEQLRQLLVDATRLRLRADVPVGAYLSGGLDSSILASLVRFESPTPLRTFSIGFDSKGHDETEYQDRMVNFLGADHSRIQLSSADVGAGFMAAIWHAESATLRTAPAPMKSLSGLVHQHGFKVVLTGEGADEVFGGYDLFKETKLRSRWARQPNSRARPLLLQRLYPYQAPDQGRAQAYLERFYGVGLDEPDALVFSHLPRLASTSLTRAFLTQPSQEGAAGQALAETLPVQAKCWSPLARAQYLEARVLMPNYLLSTQGDRMLMANAVEGRFPYLDHRLIEFANRLPDRLKVRALQEKYVLRQAMRRDLPPDTRQRVKQPYRAPEAAAFFDAQGKPLDWVADLMSEAKLKDSNYFHPRMGELLLNKARRAPAQLGNKDNQALVAMVSMQAWHQLFVSGARPLPQSSF